MQSHPQLMCHHKYWMEIRCHACTEQPIPTSEPALLFSTWNMNSMWNVSGQTGTSVLKKGVEQVEKVQRRAAKMIKAWKANQMRRGRRTRHVQLAEKMTKRGHDCCLCVSVGLLQRRLRTPFFLLLHRSGQGPVAWNCSRIGLDWVSGKVVHY